MQMRKRWNSARFEFSALRKIGWEWNDKNFTDILLCHCDASGFAKAMWIGYQCWTWSGIRITIQVDSAGQNTNQIGLGFGKKNCTA